MAESRSDRCISPCECAWSFRPLLVVSGTEVGKGPVSSSNRMVNHLDDTAISPTQCLMNTSGRSRSLGH